MPSNYHFDLPNVMGGTVSLSDYPEAKGFVVVFTCNHCPYAVAYERRLVALDKKWGPQGFPLIAISSNDVVKYPQDGPDLMRVRAEQRGFGFPYLYDESQEVAQAYGATRTPHVFLLKKDEASEGGLRCAYSGAIDDNYADEAAVQDRWLEQALEKLATGEEPARAEVPAIGCSIKWK